MPVFLGTRWGEGEPRPVSLGTRSGEGTAVEVVDKELSKTAADSEFVQQHTEVHSYPQDKDLRFDCYSVVPYTLSEEILVGLHQVLKKSIRQYRYPDRKIFLKISIKLYCEHKILNH